MSVYTNVPYNRIFDACACDKCVLNERSASYKHITKNKKRRRADCVRMLARMVTLMMTVRMVGTHSVYIYSYMHRIHKSLCVCVCMNCGHAPFVLLVLRKNQTSLFFVVLHLIMALAS